MTDRERLLQILNVAIFPHEGEDPLEAVTDYLLDNGVTFAKDTNVPANPVTPGHDNQYNIDEMSYNNGYAKEIEDGKPKWIPVSERLPDMHTKVLCCGIRGGRFIAELTTWGNGNQIWDKRNGRGCPEVTHWMPLPEPPK